uniref:Cytochrome P450 n=1 Tax=Timema monikensis TaxID=170555 RepID=A0A7R9DYK2_9NEOP|nr:unnamed protein product [Timema monikensis]
MISPSSAVKLNTSSTLANYATEAGKLFKMNLPMEISLMEIGIFISPILLYIYWRSTSCFRYWKSKGVHHLTPNLIFGNTFDLIFQRVSRFDMFRKLYEDLDGYRYGGFYQSRNPVLLVRDPELIKRILTKDFSHFIDRFTEHPVNESDLSSNLVQLGGDPWKFMRYKLSPVFSSAKMKSMFDLIVQCALDMSTSLKSFADDCSPINMNEVTSHYLVDAIGTCILGIQLNTIKDPKSEHRVMIAKAAKISLGFSIWNFLFKMSTTFRLSGMNDEVTDYIKKLVKKTIKYREENKVIRNDFLQLLINLKNDVLVDDISKEDTHLKYNYNTKHKITMVDNKCVFCSGLADITDNLLAAQCFVFYLAGFETSTSAIGFCLHELAVNQDIQDRLAEEICTILREQDNKITYEIINKMDYLDQVVNETLRKHAPASGITRVCSKPYTIPGTNINLKKGDSVLVSIPGLHFDPKYYPDPERFDPERFTKENVKSRHPYTFLPFGEGPRICIVTNSLYW